MHRFPGTIGICALLALSSPASAFMIAPSSDEDAGGYIVVIEAAAGDHVPLAALPPAYQGIDGAAWSNRGLTFRWTYFRSPEQGRMTLIFDEDERATIAVEFLGDDLADGDTVAAATALVDRDGRAIHTLYASARVAGDRFGNGGRLHRSSTLLEVAPDRWQAVAGFTFFTMKYYAIQNLDENSVATAMRRAVERVTGAGSEQWIGAVGG